MLKNAGKTCHPATCRNWVPIFRSGRVEKSFGARAVRAFLDSKARDGKGWISRRISSRNPAILSPAHRATMQAHKRRARPGDRAVHYREQSTERPTDRAQEPAPRLLPSSRPPVKGRFVPSEGDSSTFFKKVSAQGGRYSVSLEGSRLAYMRNHIGGVAGIRQLFENASGALQTRGDCATPLFGARMERHIQGIDTCSVSSAGWRRHWLRSGHHGRISIIGSIGSQP